MQHIALATLILSLLVPSYAQQSEAERRSNAPVEPFRIVGNVYYVGAADITSFLITTKKGHFLLDGGFSETAPQIAGNIQRLGFKLEDVKYLLNSQSHHDHAGGLAELKKLTGATMVASEGDKPSLERGGKDDFAWGDAFTYSPIAVQRTVKDREEIDLGGVRMRAVITPGHTRGCTTWTLRVKDERRTYDAVFVCSASVPGYTLTGNAKYPGIITDYEKTFAILKGLNADVFLAAHGVFFDLVGKTAKLRSGATPNPFIDPQGYKNYVANAEKSFRDQLVKEGTK